MFQRSVTLPKVYTMVCIVKFSSIKGGEDMGENTKPQTAVQCSRRWSGAPATSLPNVRSHAKWAYLYRPLQYWYGPGPFISTSYNSRRRKINPRGTRCRGYMLSVPSQHIPRPRVSLSGEDLVQPSHCLGNASLVAALLCYAYRLPQCKRRQLKVSEPDRA